VNENFNQFWLSLYDKIKFLGIKKLKSSESAKKRTEERENGGY